VSAEPKTFEREYTYQAGDDDSKNSSRACALREVKRLILEEIGVYLETKTEVKDFQLTGDQVVMFTAGIVKTEVLAEKWDGRLFYLKARVAADPDEVARSIDRLRKDVEKTRELEDLRKNVAALVAENDRLKREMASASDADKGAVAAAYEKNVGALNALEWFERGYASEMAGNCREAIKAYDKAIRLSADYAPAYNNRGKCYARLGDYARAAKDLDRAVALGPGIATIRYNRGNVNNRLGRYRRALADFNDAVSLDPNFAMAYNNRGNLYFRLRDYQRALADFDKAVSLDPNFAAAYYNRGNAYDRLGNRQQAIQDLITAAKQGHGGAGNALKTKGIRF
jgi:tetratricopeptide (TPR) repeat protein